MSAQNFKELQEEAWKHIGRFMWNFGRIENFINQIFVTLFNLDDVALMFIGVIDTRKKIEMLKVGLAKQGSDSHEKLLKSCHILHDLRNVIAHSSFDAVLTGDGIEFDHIDRNGGFWLADREDIGSNFISFADFDRHYDRACKIIDDLSKLDSLVTPLSNISPEMRAEIEAIIDDSPNVVRLRSRRTTEPQE